MIYGCRPYTRATAILPQCTPSSAGSGWGRRCRRPADIDRTPTSFPCTRCTSCESSCVRRVMRARTFSCHRCRACLRLQSVTRRKTRRCFKKVFFLLFSSKSRREKILLQQKQKKFLMNIDWKFFFTFSSRNLQTLNFLIMLDNLIKSRGDLALWGWQFSFRGLWFGSCFAAYKVEKLSNCGETLRMTKRTANRYLLRLTLQAAWYGSELKVKPIRPAFIRENPFADDNWNIFRNKNDNFAVRRKREKETSSNNFSLFAKLSI